MKKYLLATVLTAACCAGATLDQCRDLRLHGQVTQARACFQTLVRSSNSFDRAEGYWGLGQYNEANEEFKLAFRDQPQSAPVRAEWGSMYLEHYQPGDAAKLFEEALELDQNYAPAYLGLARVAAQGYDKKAVDLAHQAIEHDPKLAAAHEVLAQVALEDGNPKLATEEAETALKICDTSLDAMAVLASIDWLNGREQSPWSDRILKTNAHYGEGWAIGGHFLEINRRYREAIASYRKAIELDPDLWAARSNLGLNLMRLGE